MSVKIISDDYKVNDPKAHVITKENQDFIPQTFETYVIDSIDTAVYWEIIVPMMQEYQVHFLIRKGCNKQLVERLSSFCDADGNLLFFDKT